MKIPNQTVCVLYFFCLWCGFAASSCHKKAVDIPPDNEQEQAEEQPKPDTLRNLYVLNQGSVGLNTVESLTYYHRDSAIVQPDMFFNVNGTRLGKIPYDMVHYGSKLYVLIELMNEVKVINAQTGALIQSVNLNEGGQALKPRRAIAAGGKVYVSSWEGYVSVLDTASLSFTSNLLVGNNPEGMAISSGKLYVANSGLASDTDPAETVSVVDVATFTKIKEITVAPAPYDIVADSEGDLYVSCMGYGAPSAAISIINSVADTVKGQISLGQDGGSLYSGTTGFAVDGNRGLYFSKTGTGINIKVYNLTTETIINTALLADNTMLVNPYCLSIDSNTHELFIGDRNGPGNTLGKVHVFAADGTFKYSFIAGYIPFKIIPMMRVS